MSTLALGCTIGSQAAVSPPAHARIEDPQAFLAGYVARLPPGMPLAEARALLEREGFKPWGAKPADADGPATAYLRLVRNELPLVETHYMLTIEHDGERVTGVTTNVGHIGL